MPAIVGRPRLKTFTALVVVAVAATGGPTAPAASARQPRTQQLTMLLISHKVFAAPRVHPSRVGTVRAWRPITGAQTVLPVLARTRTRDGTRWLRVRLPGRPNGKKGWIKQQGTALGTTSWRLVVRTASRRVLVYHHGRRVRSVGAVVGKASTPTPRGRFFVEESVRMPSGAPGGPYALALSARSNVLQTFGGGPGQVGIHGVANLGGTLGTAISHGCIRLSNRTITWLVARIPAGAPVTITR